MIKLTNKSIDITVSIGIATYPDVEGNIEEINKAADIAMYHAKNLGRNNYQFFAPKMQKEAVERIRMEG